jgi:hypothetical protein
MARYLVKHGVRLHGVVPGKVVPVLHFYLLLKTGVKQYDTQILVHPAALVIGIWAYCGC